MSQSRMLWLSTKSGSTPSSMASRTRASFIVWFASRFRGLKRYRISAEAPLNCMKKSSVEQMCVRRTARSSPPVTPPATAPSCRSSFMAHVDLPAPGGPRRISSLLGKAACADLLLTCSSILASSNSWPAFIALARTSCTSCAARAFSPRCFSNESSTAAGLPALKQRRKAAMRSSWPCRISIAASRSTFVWEMAVRNSWYFAP
mmetsp:Transcript_80075/g.226645  ORF Transcript_80075/g.226645 Transcript_80075/m.226645 type:complete len:204 (-) Transcript_80075:346-957(-)